MAKRQPPGGGRKGPESEYNREMRKAFERSNNKENRPVDNRSLIPQLMRELVEVHGVRRAGPQQQQQQQAAAARYVRRTPAPPREVSITRPQIPQAGPSSQGEPRASTSGSKWGEFLATRHLRARATPFTDVKVPDKEEGISVGKMTIQADVHQEEATAMEVASGGQIENEYPYHRATAEQIAAEPQYAVPHKKKYDDAPKVDISESVTTYLDPSSDRPPTPHPRSWLPVGMKCQGENYPQNIHQQEGYEDKIQHKRQYPLTDEEQFHLDTQLAIQHSLQEAYIHSQSERYFREDEITVTESQKKHINICDSKMPHVDSPQPTHLNVHMPLGLKAQYSVRDDTVMVPTKRETKTNNVAIPVHTGPPKPARLYVRGVNAPPGMMEPTSSVVPRISNVQCPPPNNNDEIWEDIIPEAPPKPQQELSTQEDPETCCESYMETFMETIYAMGRCFRDLGNYVWRYICHCEPIPGTCAYN